MYKFKLANQEFSYSANLKKAIGRKYRYSPFLFFILLVQMFSLESLISRREHQLTISATVKG